MSEFCTWCTRFAYTMCKPEQCGFPQALQPAPYQSGHVTVMVHPPPILHCTVIEQPRGFGVRLLSKTAVGGRRAGGDAALAAPLQNDAAMPASSNDGRITYLFLFLISPSYLCSMTGSWCAGGDAALAAPLQNDAAMPTGSANGSLRNWSRSSARTSIPQPP